ncbi:MAG: CDP-alcohol phosphatidyltransferase family protein [archaeon]|nr:CDP-alcohol phosphatidyltransferase family protein [archaeon]
MVLDKHRKDAEFTLAPVARRFINVNPNTISWLGLIMAAVSGVLLYMSWAHHWLLVPAAIAVIISGYFDALDGKIAKLAGKCSVKGDYLDHVFDRYADMFMIAAIAVSGWCNTYIGLLAVIGVLLTSYMGTQAQAIGAKRLYDGLLGRADRVVLCFLFPIIEAIACALGYGTLDISGYSLSWMEIMMIYFAVLGNLTAIQRGIITWRNLTEAEKTSSEEEKKE